MKSSNKKHGYEFKSVTTIYDQPSNEQTFYTLKDIRKVSKFSECSEQIEYITKVYKDRIKFKPTDCGKSLKTIKFKTFLQLTPVYLDKEALFWVIKRKKPTDYLCGFITFEDVEKTESFFSFIEKSNSKAINHLINWESAHRRGGMNIRCKETYTHYDPMTHNKPVKEFQINENLYRTIDPKLRKEDGKFIKFEAPIQRNLDDMGCPGRRTFKRY